METNELIKKKMEPKKLLTILTFVLVVLFTGCKKDDFVDNPGVCPIVESTDPIDVATGVSVKKVITATFNEEMDPATINSSSFTISGATKGESLTDGEVTYSGLTATFTPSSPLVANTVYTGTIKKTAKDPKGLALQADYVWTFSTAVPPTVILVDPLNLATSVALNKVVSATFSEAMDPLTITATTFTLMNGAVAVPGTVAYSGTTATFTPASPLILGRTYTATINTNAKSVPGVALAANYVWSFSTGALIAPTVISTDPLSLATNVALNKVVTANFSVAMDPLTIIAANFKLMDGLTPVAGTVTYAGTTATFTPVAALVLGKTYTATITNSVKNVAGTAMLNNYVWAFSTGSVVAPTVILTDPLDLAINVPLNQAVNATFSVPMNAATITTSTYTLMDGVTPVTGVVTYAGIVATFTPSAPLSAGKTYTATVTTGATNATGTAMTANYVWSFSTLPLYSLTVVAVNGGVVKNPDQVSYVSGSSVVLTATPNAGYTFTSWSGDATGTTNPLTVNMNAAKNITANFTINSYSLNVVSLNGVVTKSPVQVSYDYGTSVGLTAVANTGYTFASWSGDATGIINPVTVTMDANKTVTANYTINNYTLNVAAVNGSVVKNPDQLTYDYGTIVELTAVPASGYAFTSWSGDLTGAVSPKSLLMNANKNVTANFDLLAAVCTLGLSGDYVILAESGISTTGTTAIVGDMGISPAAATFITGFGLILPAGGAYSTSSLVTGKVYAPGYAAPTPSDLTTATTNMTTAFTAANSLAPGATELLAGNLNGQTLAAGVYKWGTGLLITNALTLDGGGDPCASFVFQIAGDLTVANSTIITLTGGAVAKNIFWVVAGSKAELGTGVNFSGNILCQTLISVNTGSQVLGRLLAQTAVTINASTVTMP
jgi:uncharacterized repeat protein (TIGR02543 family)